MLDPTDPTAFVAGLTFVDTGAVDLEMTPIITTIPTVPESSSTLSLFALGTLSGVSILKKKLKS